MPVVHTGKALTWEFRDATENSKNGYQVTLRFTCADPALEMKSVWQAVPGPGPVENWATVENKSGGNGVFLPTSAASKIALWPMPRTPPSCRQDAAGGARSFRI